MKTKFTTVLVLTLVLVMSVSMLGCAKANTTTPAAPLPAQAVIVQAINTLASEDDAMVHAVIAARKDGTVAPGDAAMVENAGKTIATAGLQLNAELRSSDPWCTSNILASGCQQAKLIMILQGIGLGQLYAHISPSMQVFFTAVLTAANTLSADLGGPTL